MRPYFFLLTLAAGSMQLTSCETTGDPSQGGLFGWSQSKADVRIQERQNTLSSLDDEREYNRRRKNNLQAERDRLKNQ
ncbi:hypothetical protein [Prosthecobacter sp.]|uniref:hypothetical protein n=1 Tax=Prosthecobacter sp. TaxID=1965333 RepID=UPI0037851D83